MPELSIDNQTSPQAKEYNRIKNFLLVANLVFVIVALLAFAVTGLAVFARAYLRTVITNSLILNGAYFFVFYSVFAILAFPLECYEGFILEHQFALSRQRFASWFADYLKKNAITFVVLLLVVECIYIFIGRFYDRWWVGASLLWLGITVLLTKIFPLVILPLFFKSRPLPDDELRRRLCRLAQTFRFAISNIFILGLSAKTKKANAMVTGMGKTKRIYLSDTLLSDFSPQEIEIVVAHELTHDRHRDLYKHLIVSFAVSMFSFFVCDYFLGRAVLYFGYIAKDDVANLPILSLLFMLASIFVLPLQNGFSRRLEASADIGSIQATGNASAFITMITKLGKMNLSEFRPNKVVEFFLYDHPPIDKRISSARQFLSSAQRASSSVVPEGAAANKR